LFLRFQLLKQALEKLLAKAAETDDDDYFDLEEQYAEAKERRRKEKILRDYAEKLRKMEEQRTAYQETKHEEQWEDEELRKLKEKIQAQKNASKTLEKLFTLSLSVATVIGMVLTYYCIVLKNDAEEIRQIKEEVEKNLMQAEKAKELIELPQWEQLLQTSSIPQKDFEYVESKVETRDEEGEEFHSLEEVFFNAPPPGLSSSLLEKKEEKALESELLGLNAAEIDLKQKSSKIVSAKRGKTTATVLKQPKKKKKRRKTVVKRLRVEQEPDQETDIKNVRQKKKLKA
jgi:hypothetical protein